PPYQAGEVAELLRMHASSAIPSLHKLRPEIRPVLSDVVSKLLAKDPDDRYQTAAGLLWDLEHLTEIERSRSNRPEIALGSKDSHFRLVPEIPLVGRDSEMAAARRAWERARAGNGAIVQVEGEGGSGKTRLVRELL